MAAFYWKKELQHKRVTGTFVRSALVSWCRLYTAEVLPVCVSEFCPP